MAAGRNNTSWKVILGKKPMHSNLQFLLAKDWAKLPTALIIFLQKLSCLFVCFTLIISKNIFLLSLFGSAKKIKPCKWTIGLKHYKTGCFPHQLHPVANEQTNADSEEEKKKKSRIWETPTLSTDADSRTDSYLKGLRDWCQKKIYKKN